MMVELETLLVNRRFSVTAFVLIFFCIGLTNAQPTAVKLVSPVKNQIIRYRNQSVLFNCTITQANGSTFQWIREDRVIDPAGKKDTPYWSSFVLTGLRTQDEGEYSCSYGESGIKSATVIVRLAEKPKAYIVKLTSPITVNEDDKATLHCGTTGWPMPNITWTRNGQNVLDINQNNQYEVVPGEAAGSLDLIIIAIHREDQGKYICVAKNALGEHSQSFEVHVKEDPVLPKPTMKAKESKYTAVVGTDANLVCTGEQVVDNVFTIVFWEFNGTELFNSSDHVITNYFFAEEVGGAPKVRTQLSVLNVMFEDSGNYSCSLESERTKTTLKDTVTLEVKAKDKDKKNKLKTWMIVVISVIAAMLCLFLAVLIIVVYRRKRRRKKFLALAQKYDEEDNNDFKNELFISYSTKDYDWIQESLLSLLDKNDIKYIIHSRDFVPGKAWHENMADSVYNSRKVILVMSMNYLSSVSCKYEMGMAIHRNSVKDDSSLIVVRIGNIRSRDIPKSLRHRTFIDVTSREEANTWQKRILEYVRSENRSASLTSDESSDVADARSLLSRFKLKMKKKRNKAERELENQA